MGVASSIAQIGAVKNAEGVIQNFDYSKSNIKANIKESIGFTRTIKDEKEEWNWSLKDALELDFGHDKGEKLNARRGFKNIYNAAGITSSIEGAWGDIETAVSDFKNIDFKKDFKTTKKAKEAIASMIEGTSKAISVGGEISIISPLDKYFNKPLCKLIDGINMFSPESAATELPS